MGTSPVKITEMAANKIKLARNSRMGVRDEELAGLMQSIKEVGLLQPIGVVKTATNGYEVIYGNRRFLALTKLGKTKIPVIIHAHKTSAEDDLKNLTENLQRRNISLIEAGRYIELLTQQGLQQAEIAIRLGVSKAYISNCLTAYNEVPKEFQKDIEVRHQGGSGKKTPGKIAMQSVRAIMSADKSIRGVTSEVKRELFKLAKTEERFNHKNVMKYARAIRDGVKDPVGTTEHLKKMNVQFWMDESEWDTIHAQQVASGTFKSVHGFLVAVLAGTKNYKIRTIKA